MHHCFMCFEASVAQPTGREDTNLADGEGGCSLSGLCERESLSVYISCQKQGNISFIRLVCASCHCVTFISFALPPFLLVELA